MHIAVVLVRPKGPINVGLVARACANAGVSDLRLVQADCDLQDVLCRQFAHHAQRLLHQAQHFDAVSAAVQDRHWVIGTSARRRRGGWPKPASIVEVQSTLTQRHPTKIALVFGSEADGLSKDEALACHQLLYLPASSMYPSYNLSHAVAITLFAFGHQQRDGMEPSHPMSLATVATKQHLFDDWRRALKTTGYFKRINEDRVLPKLAQLFQKLHLTEPEAHLLFSMVKHFSGVCSEQQTLRPQEPIKHR